MANDKTRDAEQRQIIEFKKGQRVRHGYLMTRRAGKNRNTGFFKVEKNMFVTPVFYLGAGRNRFTIALQHRSFELVHLFSRGLPRKPGLISISLARGCLKHLFLSKSSQTTL